MNNSFNNQLFYIAALLSRWHKNLLYPTHQAPPSPLSLTQSIKTLPSSTQSNQPTTPTHSTKSCTTHHVLYPHRAAHGSEGIFGTQESGVLLWNGEGMGDVTAELHWDTHSLSKKRVEFGDASKYKWGSYYWFPREKGHNCGEWILRI